MAEDPPFADLAERIASDFHRREVQKGPNLGHEGSSPALCMVFFDSLIGSFLAWSKRVPTREKTESEGERERETEREVASELNVREKAGPSKKACCVTN